MDAFQTEDDQLQQIKQWWSKNGKQVLTGVTVALVLGGGIRLWMNYQDERRMSAASIYEQVLQGLEKKDNAVALQQGAKVIEQYANTPYAALSGLIVARLEWDKGDKEGARNHLNWVLDHATNDEMRHVARLRLARMMMADNKLDDALKLTDQKDAGAFAAAYQFVKGSILLQQGNAKEAEAAFLAVVNDTTATGEIHNQAQQQLDDMGVPTLPKLGAKS